LVCINPINNYGVNINIGDYVSFSENTKAKRHFRLYVLCSQRQFGESQKHFQDVPRMLNEHWFGPYPFYEDSYKLVEAPYLGMEHQSSYYGNKFQNGYLGRDLAELVGD
jgi:hypothetical protein